MNNDPVGTPAPTNPAPAAAPAPAPAAPATPSTPPVVQAGAPVAEAPAAPKKKTGLIITIIIAALILIGGAVAAVLVLFVFNKSADAVPAAMSKVLSGEVKNFALDGTITVSGNSNPVISGANISLSAKINTSSLENSIATNISANIGGIDLSFSLDEERTAKGNTYIKLDGITDSLDSMMRSMLEQSGIDCSQMDCDTLISQAFSGSANQLAVIDTIEGEWLHADFDDSSVTTITDNKTQCLVNALSGASNYSDDIKNIYEQNQFVTYSTDNISIEKKKDTIYKLGIDNAKMASFINALNGSAFANNLLACAGDTATKKDVTESDVAQIFGNFPTVYVEIDGKNNFTRLYIASEETGLVADFAISYIDNVIVNEPDSYLEMSDYLSEIMQSIGGLSGLGGDVEYDDDDDWGDIEWDIDWED